MIINVNGDDIQCDSFKVDEVPMGASVKYRVLKSRDPYVVDKDGIEILPKGESMTVTLQG